jgi:hypothetical protein
LLKEWWMNYLKLFKYSSWPSAWILYNGFQRSSLDFLSRPLSYYSPWISYFKYTESYILCCFKSQYPWWASGCFLNWPLLRGSPSLHWEVNEMSKNEFEFLAPSHL